MQARITRKFVAYGDDRRNFDTYDESRAVYYREFDCDYLNNDLKFFPQPGDGGSLVKRIAIR